MNTPLERRCVHDQTTVFCLLPRVGRTDIQRLSATYTMDFLWGRFQSCGFRISASNCFARRHTWWRCRGGPVKCKVFADFVHFCIPLITSLGRLLDLRHLETVSLLTHRTRMVAYILQLFHLYQLGQLPFSLGVCEVDQQRKAPPQRDVIY